MGAQIIGRQFTPQKNKDYKVNLSDHQVLNKEKKYLVHGKSDDNFN